MNETHTTRKRKSVFYTTPTDFTMRPANYNRTLDSEGKCRFSLPGLTQYSKVTAAFAQNTSIGGTLFVYAQGVDENDLGYADISSSSSDDAGKNIIVTVHTL